MTCERCERLAAENEALRYELDFPSDARLDALNHTFGLRAAPAQIVLMLYAAGERTVSWMGLAERIGYGGELGNNNVRVHITRIRSLIGKDAIVNVWGRGYTLSPSARARIADVLSK